MIYQIHHKNLLFIEPCSSSRNLIYQAKIREYGTFVISANDSYLRFSKENHMAASSFFELDINDEASVLNIVKQISKKFIIDGVIPGEEVHNLLTAKIARFLGKPGLKPDIATHAQQKNLLNHLILQKQNNGQYYIVEGIIKDSKIFIFL